MNTAFCHMPVLWHPRGEKRITERRRERREGREKERGEESSAELSQIHNKCISCFDMHVPQVKIKLLAVCCSLADGSNYCSLLSAPERAMLFFGVWSTVAAGGVVSAGKQMKTEEKLTQSLVSRNQLSQLTQLIWQELCLEMEGCLKHGFLSQPLC